MKMTGTSLTRMWSTINQAILCGLNVTKLTKRYIQVDFDVEVVYREEITSAVGRMVGHQCDIWAINVIRPLWHNMAQFQELKHITNLSL